MKRKKGGREGKGRERKVAVGWSEVESGGGVWDWLELSHKSKP